MALLSKKQFEQLAAESGKNCISIYLPTERSGTNRKSIVRLKNHLKKVEGELREQGEKPESIANLLRPVQELIYDMAFWRYLSDALILFIHEGHLKHYTLPLEVDDFSMVGQHYYLLPLLSMFNKNDGFFILTLSQNQHMLYEANPYEIQPVDAGELLPESLEAATGGNVRQKSLQFRSGQAQGGLGLYHGQGEGKDDKQQDIKKYLTEVDRGVNGLIDAHGTPLVVASVESLFSMYRELSTYKNLFPVAISGNWDHEDILLVHERACELLAPYFDELRNRQKEMYAELNHKTTSRLDEMINAARAGGVETLFVKKHERVWGEIGENTGVVAFSEKRKPEDICLLDYIARSTFLKGGHVFLEHEGALPKPEAKANAILRY